MLSLFFSILREAWLRQDSPSESAAGMSSTAQGCGRELLAAGGYRMSALQQVLVSFASATEVKKLAIQHK